MEEFQTVGKPFPHVDARDKATGRTLFISDFKLSGMLSGGILRSPIPHAYIKGYNLEKARSVKGIVAILTGQDIPRNPWGPKIQDTYALAVEKVRYVGDEVVAIAGVDEDAVSEALGFIEVDYEELPAVFDPREALSPDAPKIHDREQDNRVAYYHFHRGNVEEGFNKAHLVLEETYQTSLVHHLYLEPHTAVARYERDTLYLWTTLQGPFVSQISIAKTLEISPSNLRIIQLPGGGAFGGKGLSNTHLICGLLAKVTGRAVAVRRSVAEELMASRPRVPESITLKMGVTRDGTITAKQMKILADAGAYAGLSPVVLHTSAIRADALYRYQNIETEATGVYTNKIPTGACRGYGNPQTHFAVESHLDTIASLLGMSPLELRLKNATEKGDVTAHGWVMKSCELKSCLRKVTEASGFPKNSGDQKSVPATKVAADPGLSTNILKGRRRRGKGLACFIHVSSSRAHFKEYDGSAAEVWLYPDGKVRVVTPETDFGQGAHTVLAQIAAEELEIPLSSVQVIQPDTHIGVFGLGLAASRITTLGGNAVKAAAANALDKLRIACGKILNAEPESLGYGSGRFWVKDHPERSLLFGETIQAALYANLGLPIVGRGTFDPETQPPDESGYGNISAAYTFGAQVVEVEVDIDTGQVEVVSVYSAHDAGRIINPLLAAGQVTGGVVMGLGYALSEELQVRDGRVQNSGLQDYRVFLSPGTPPIHPLFVEEEDPVGPFGAKGLGEPPLIGIAPAVANAIFDALGVRMTTLPITPERILASLNKRKELSIVSH